VLRPGSCNLSLQVAAVLARCRAQKDRCAELAKYMQNCINVRFQLISCCCSSLVMYIRLLCSQSAQRDIQDLLLLVDG
jgi:hypothetical protein